MSSVGRRDGKGKEGEENAEIGRDKTFGKAATRPGATLSVPEGQNENSPPFPLTRRPPSAEPLQAASPAMRDAASEGFQTVGMAKIDALFLKSPSREEAHSR